MAVATTPRTSLSSLRTVHRSGVYIIAHMVVALVGADVYTVVQRGLPLAFLPISSRRGLVES
jgi:hypothetical protein